MPGQDLQGGWSGQRDGAVTAGRHAVREGQRCTDNFLDAEQVHADGAADDIDNRINRTHFVKMHLVQFNLMDMGFCFTETAEDLSCHGFNRGSKVACGNHRVDLRPGARRLPGVTDDFYASSGNAVPLFRPLFEAVSGNRQTGQLLLQFFEVDAEIDQQA